MHAKRQTQVKKMRSLRLNSGGHPHTVFRVQDGRGTGSLDWITIGAALESTRPGASGVEPYAEVQRLSRRTVSPTIVVIRFRICGHA